MTRRGGWLVVLAIATAAHADNVSDAIALFDTGQKLFDAGKIDEACEAFVASVRLDPQLGAKLNLANCRERQQRFADAFTLYEDVVAEAARTKKPGRETFAKQRLDAIRSKVARYKLRVALPHPPGLTIKQIQGTGTVEIPPAQWAESRLANAGAIVLEVSAPFRMTTRVGGNLEAGKDSEIVVPTLDIDATSAPPPHTADPPPSKPLPPRPVVVERKRSRVPLIVMSVGGGFSLGSLALGLQARSHYHRALDERSQPEIDKSRDQANLATLVGVVGVITLGVGVVLRIRETDTMLVPTTSSTSAGVAAIGRF